jgi:hypothetical protein
MGSLWYFNFTWSSSTGWRPFPETIIRFFGYFTVLSNILVATCFTIILIEPGSGWGRFFAKPATLTAVTVYITVVGIIYNAILRFLWSPKGLQLVVDELLHSIVPVLVIVYWAIAVPGQRLKYKLIGPWLIYPGIYCLYSMIRGSFAAFYPYPFLDVVKLGYQKVLINILGVLFVFIAVSAIFIFITNYVANLRQRKMQKS